MTNSSPLHFLGGARAYFDANVFIYRVESEPAWQDLLGELWKMLDGGQLTAITSELSLAECLIWPIQERNRARQREFSRLIETQSKLLVIPIKREILLEAARLRALHHLEMPDAIHAATAKTARCTHFLTADVALAQVVGARAVDLNALTTGC